MYFLGKTDKEWEGIHGLLGKRNDLIKGLKNKSNGSLKFLSNNIQC